jgi:hypothetical protein
MLLELTDQERDLLVRLVQRELDELGPEIHHTVRRDYREDLKTERRRLSELLSHLAAVPAPR